MTQFVPPQIWTRHAVLPDIRAGSPNKNTFQCLGVNLRAVQSNGDYEGTTSRETHSARSDKKITPEFDSEIKPMIDNDPPKSTRAIARGTGVSEFLIRQTVHEDIRYFSYKMRRGQQDSAQCHTILSRRTLAWLAWLSWLSYNLSDHITRDMCMVT